MVELNGQIGELTFTIEVKRKDTGKIDKFEVIGKVTNEDNENGGHTLDSSTERSN